MAHNVSAATYYVSGTDGDDTNCTGLAQMAYVSGSSQPCPWKTLTKVNSVETAGTVAAGDSILFKRGETFTGNLVVKVAGTAGNIFTFGQYGAGEKPIIDTTGINHGIDITLGSSYLTFDNLSLKNALLDGFFIRAGSSSTTIQNTDISASHIGIRGFAGTINNLTLSGITSNSGTIGINTESATLNGLTISSSTFSGNSQYGMNIVGSNTNINISGSYFNTNTLAGAVFTLSNTLVITSTKFNSNTGIGLDLLGVSNVTINNITASSNTQDGFSATNSGATASSNIYITDSTFNSNGSAARQNGFSLLGAGSTLTATRVTAANNYGDGFNVHNTWSGVIFDDCTADTNGTDGLTSDGDGFSFHETTSGTIKYSISKNNKKSAIAHVGGAQVTMEYNIFSHTTNGTIGLVYLVATGTYYLYNNVIYSAAQTGYGVQIDGPTVMIKNNLIYGFDDGIVKSSGTTTEDYNDVYRAATANWQGLSQGAHSISQDPLFYDAGSANYTLNYLSTAIDSGTNVGLTTDYLGNPIYGNTDIGAYEYQPPYTMGTDSITPNGNIRIYRNGKYRYTSATSSAVAADFSVSPLGGSFSASNYSEWLNLSNITWNTSGDYSKSWTASSSVATTTVFTIGNLVSSTYYTTAIDGASSSTAQADSNGRITYTYTGGYSTHNFTVTSDSTGPNSFSLLSPANNASFISAPSVSWNTTTDTESGLSKYQLYVDGGLNVDNISSSTTSVSSVGNFTCGSHSWYIKAVDNAGNSKNSSETYTFNISCGVAIPVNVSQPSVAPINVPIDLTPPQLGESISEQGPTTAPVVLVNSGFVFKRFLTIGSTGTDVKQLQTILKKLGYFTYPKITGYFGSITKQAVIKFQKAYKLKPYPGYVGPGTRAALNGLNLK